jgi:uncharacterized protein involved in outer membrane biogenesis
MSWRIARRVLTALAALLILIVGAGFALLHLPALEDARSRIAANLLSSYLGETVVVDGGVDLTFGPTIDIVMQGVSPVGAASGAPAPVGTVRMSFSRGAALRGRLALTALNLSSMRVIVDAAEPSTETLGRSISKAVQGALSSPLVRNLKLRDVRILRIKDPAGWNGTLSLDTVTSRETDRAGTVSIEAKGSLNGQAFVLSGKVQDLSLAPGPASDGATSLTLTFQGVEAALEGGLTRDAGELGLTARLKVRSPSLGEVQDVLSLARVAEGTGTLELALDGALARLAVGSATLRIETAEGRVYEVNGEVADLWAADGIDLAIAATLVPPGSAAGQSPLELAPRSIRGRVSSREGGFEIDDVVVETGLAALELQEIGPIRIARIARDEEGRLRFEGIRLVQGDARDPTLDLSGHLNDVLALRDFALRGKFRLQMAPLLSGRPNATGLGLLRGEAAISDARGHLRLERLDAKLQGTDLMSLSLQLEKAGKNPEEVGLRLAVPDLAPLAAALGRKASGGTRIAFDGAFGAADGTAVVHGALGIGRTDLQGRLRIDAAKGRPEIRGRIRASDLHLDDLIAAREVAGLFSHRKADVVRLREGVQEETTLHLDIAADALAGGGAGASGLNASLVYARSRLQFSLDELRYLGGRIHGALDARFALPTPALKLTATARRLRLEQAFARLGHAPAASGPLDLDLDVTASGDEPRALLASLTGEVAASIRGESLADRTINLAGQTIIEWIFTPSADGSAPLVCFVARFDFKDGVGKARTLVLETDKVQAPSAGSLDLRTETMDFAFAPRPKRPNLVGRVGPVGVRGPLSSPEVELADGAVAAKVLGETIGLPLHLLGSLIGANGRLPPGHEPCVVVPVQE